MRYLVRLFTENLKLWLPYYAFLVGTILLASYTEFTTPIIYAWVACGLLVGISILYNYIFGDLGWLDTMVILAAPVLLLIAYNLTIGLMVR